jgi:acetylornithine deacetylase/succinyl-diaminopimelate desuccinylase-like protein
MELDLLQIARALVRAETVSARGTSAAVEILKPLYERLGWKVQLAGEGPGQENFLATTGPAQGPGVLFVTHLDTVDPGPRDLWKTDPFELTVDGDRWTGLGSADVKIDAACKLLAFSRLAANREWARRPVGFLGTFKEEVGCRGARHFVEHPLFPFTQVVCGEPSELKIVDAHKGYLVVRIEIRGRRAASRLPGPFRRVVVEGRSAHSSTPHLGENAILKGLSSLASGIGRVVGGSVANKVPARMELWVADPQGTEEIPDAAHLDDAIHLAQQLFRDWSQWVAATSGTPNTRFDPPHAVANWGKLHSSGDSLQLLFDCRLMPGQKPSDVLTPFEAALRAQVSGRWTVTLDVDRSNEAMELARPSPLLEAAQQQSRELGLDDQPRAKPTNTEAGVFASAGAEALVFGPSISTNNAHCANEYALASQCQRAIDFYEGLARRLGA